MSKFATVSSQAITQEVDGETVILDLGSEQYFSLDTVGTRVWQLIREGKSIDGITRQMETEYEVDPVQLAGDLDRLFGALLEQGLISMGDLPGENSD